MVIFFSCREGVSFVPFFEQEGMHGCSPLLEMQQVEGTRRHATVTCESIGFVHSWRGDVGLAPTE